MFAQLYNYAKFALAFKKALCFFRMAHGVTGNTSVFGTEESRFEP